MSDVNSVMEMNHQDKLDVLRMLENSHRQEIMHHRNLQFRAFSWTNGLFLAVFGGLVAVKTSQIEIGTIGSVLLTTIIVSITVTTLVLMIRSARALETNAKLVVEVDKIMGLFKPGHFCIGNSVYPKKWLGWGANRKASFETWFHLINTLILGTAVVTATWTLI